ncbi:iron-sulfur cluster assembly protein [Williamsia sp. 1138]|uniref:iron-sulfur cluster assembly protein n=1 Tax=Williamsia sp. 1138 TaxID=1903117 RepID=UPI001AEFD13A|nr:iron-sulfur cluster assembly protein [Williamsia sp. 1138]
MTNTRDLTGLDWPSAIVGRDHVVAEKVWKALGTVQDPELDEPITDLKFVTTVEIDRGEQGAEVSIRLRLPTYFCAPNFAYLMVADAYDAVAALPEVARTSVRLEDHFASDEINSGVAARAGFTGSFPTEAIGELEELRQTFQRKAYLASLDRMTKRLAADGVEFDAYTSLRIGDLPSGLETDSLMRRRSDVGLPLTEMSLVMIEHDGEAMSAERLPKRLRFAKSVRVSIEGNGIFCRGLLETRYGDDESPGTQSGIGAFGGADLGMPTLRRES